jgi:hypothetical protein
VQICDTQDDVKSLEKQKRDLYNQVTEEGSNLEYYRVQSQREKENFNSIQERRKKAEMVAIHFENNNPEYIKLERTVKEKVHTTLLDGKPFIHLALFCLIESIKENPYKYSPLIDENRPPTTVPRTPYYADYPYGQHPPTNYFDTKTMLAEEGEKMYNVLAKDLADRILEDYPVSKSPQLSLPLLPSDIEQKNSEFSNQRRSSGERFKGVQHCGVKARCSRYPVVRRTSIGWASQHVKTVLKFMN